jgi:hypothetical protein
MTIWVNMPIPEHIVKEVMSMVMQEISGEESTVQSQSVDKRTDSVDTYFRGWTEAELRLLLDNPTRSVSIIIPYLAEHPGDWVGSPTLAILVYGDNATGNQLGGALGSLTRRVMRDFGKPSERAWPFDARLNEDTGFWEYRMDEETAEVVRRILGL